MLKQIPPFLLLAFLMAGCNNDADTLRNQYRWLSGKWEGKDGETQVIETWKWQHDRFEGEGYRINDGDTTSSELLFIDSYGSAVGYSALLNHTELWSFQADPAQENRLVVRNKRNDFPKMISYVLESDSSVVITLEGEMRGSAVSTSYTMKRKGRSR
jgi:hypothetical protein